MQLKLLKNETFHAISLKSGFRIKKLGTYSSSGVIKFHGSTAKL